MVLVDTSVWVDHFRNGNAQLIHLLDHGDVLCHPFIVGELACGNLKNRSEIITLLQALPMTLQASQQEVLQFIEYHQLMGKGLGLIDMHLLASSLLSDAKLWALDKHLSAVAAHLHKT